MLQVLIHDHVFPEIRMPYCENHRELIIIIGVGKSVCRIKYRKILNKPSGFIKF